MPFLKDPTSATRWYGIVLMALCLLLSACAHKPQETTEAKPQVLDEMRTYITSLPDADRVELLLNIVDRLETDLSALNQNRIRFAKVARALYADYDASPDDFNTLIDEYGAGRALLQQLILASHFEMKDLTSPEEWQQLAKIEEDALTEGLKQTLFDIENGEE